MSTLIEIEQAAGHLSEDEKEQLLIWLATALRTTRAANAEPRQLSATEIQGWIDEDEKDLKDFRGQG